ncbi:MAG: glycosyltransferase family 4 protein [Devosia sp.]
MAEPTALFVAPSVPARTGNGLAMRLGMFLEALSRVADTHLVIVPAFGPPPATTALPDELGVATTVLDLTGKADTHLSLIMRIADPAERLAQFRRLGRGTRHSRLSSPVLNEIAAIAAAHPPTLLHVGRLYLGAAIAGVKAPLKTLDLDEDDAWSWRSGAQAGVAPDWADAEAEAETRLLSSLMPAVTRFFISGPADAARLQQGHPGIALETINNAVHVPAETPHRDDGRTLLFVGAFGYAPNADGMRWFIREVWPKLTSINPAPRLLLAGRDIPPDLHQQHGRAGIEVLGAVKDVAGAYASATLAIAPLHSGGGTRIKLMEAAAFGVPIISTPLAAAGLSFGTDSAMWLAEDAEAFAAAIADALARPAERRLRAGLASAAVGTYYDRTIVIEQLSRSFAGLLAPLAR